MDAASILPICNRNSRRDFYVRITFVASEFGALFYDFLSRALGAFQVGEIRCARCSNDTTRKGRAMKIKLMSLVAALALVATMAIGAGTAAAHGGPGKSGRNGGRAAVGNALLKDAATRLSVTTAALKTAIAEAAVAQIDAAVEDEELDADDAADLKETVEDNLQVAYRLSTARSVAAELDTTAAKLNAAFREARKAQAIAQIDAALEDEDITADEAAELKEDVADATWPGYKPAALAVARETRSVSFGRG
jgi:hypothetical protein